MSSRIQGGIIAGSQSLSWSFVLRKSTDATAQTGKVAADFTAYFFRQGDSAATVISLSDLGAISTAYTSGGVKEISSTNMPGLYRIDLPNTMFAAGADWVQLAISCAGCFTYQERLPIQHLMGRGTVGSSSTTTSVTTSAFSPAPGVINQFTSRVILFDADTTTQSLRGVVGVIAASTNSSTPTLTVATLPATPASGDRFTIL